MDMENTKKNQQGFSLMEVMVAVGIGALIVLGITQALTLSFKQSARLDKRMDIIQLSQILQASFSSGSVCTDNFSGQSVNRTNPIHLQMTELKLNSSAPPIVRVGEEYGDKGLEVSSIQLTGLTPLGGSPTEFIGTVNVELSSGSGALAPASFATLFTINASNVIDSCSKKVTVPSSGTSSSGSSSGNPNCNSVPGTFGNVYAGHVDEDRITLYQCVNGKQKTILNWSD